MAKKKKNNLFDKKKNKKNSKKNATRAISLDNLSEEEKLIKEAEELYAPIPHSDSFNEDDFSTSVNELKDTDIPEEEMEGKKKKKKKRKLSPLENAIQFSIIGICAIVAIVCAVMLVKNIYGKIRGNEIYDNTEFNHFTLDDSDSDLHFNHPSALANISSDTPMLSLYSRISKGESVNNSSKNEYAEKLSNMKASLTALKAKNSDIYGWIYVEGTNIDYPLLRGTDNDYYLDHAYTGESLPIGSIFLDYHMADLVTDNYNTVIYGHNVVTGAMFHDVTKFLDEDFFFNHKLYIYTMDGVFIYEPISVYSTKESYFYYRTVFSGEQDFVNFANEVISKSSVASGKKVTSGDTIITLSTCTNGASDGRYALHARLIEAIK